MDLIVYDKESTTINHHHHPMYCGQVNAILPDNDLSISVGELLYLLRNALHLCDERNWEKVLIETDCLTAVKLIQGEINEHHPDRVLIEDCRKMTKDLKTEVTHVLWEANNCADKIAKLGGQQGEIGPHGSSSRGHH